MTNWYIDASQQQWNGKQLTIIHFLGIFCLEAGQFVENIESNRSMLIRISIFL